MNLTKQDLKAVQQLIDNSVNNRVQPMIEAVDDALSRQIANGFAEVDRQFLETKDKLQQLYDKLDTHHLQLDNHEDRIAKLERQT